MEGKLRGRIDGVYRSGVTLLANTWRNHPYRIPVLLVVFLLSLTASSSVVFFPPTKDGLRAEPAKASTYQFTPTAGNLVTGTAQNANSLLAAAAEGVNTGSWKGTLADDNFHWQVTAADSGTPNLNMQLDLGTAKVSGANKILIQTEVDLDSASRLLNIQICDWVSSTSVDAAADTECTTGGWRSLVSQNASNADVTIGITTATAFQWHIFDGYFSSGTGGGTTVSTPLTNFTSSDTQPIRIRYWSDSDVVGTADFAVDFLRATVFIDSVYHPTGVVNQNGSGGALTGTYANAHVVGNSSTAQQSVTAGNAVRLEGAGTAGSVADYYLVFKNVKTYTGANTWYLKADYSCSAATAGLDHKFSIYNFATTTWVDFNSAVIACSTTDATNAWAENNITPADFIDESASDEVRVRFLGDLNSTTTLRIDFAYLMLGSTNTDSAQCEITWGTGTATNCTNTRDLIGPATMASFSNTAETESNTANNDYYALDCDNDATAEQCSASNINFPVTVPTDGQVVVNHFAGKFAAGLDGTNPDMTVQLGFREYAGMPTSAAAAGGWTQVGATSTNATQVYTDSITALAIGTYGNQVNPDDHVNTTNNLMNLRLRTTASGATGRTTTTEWDFAFVSIGWVVDSSHPTRSYQFAPTGDTLAVGTETARLAQTAAANTGVNTGGWQGTLGDDNFHWTVAGANAASATNFDVQLNFATAKQNGANKLLVQTEFDTDLNISANVQICDWVSSTSVDAAADGNCTTGGWRSLVSQNASNADVTYTGTTAVVLQWHIFDGYFTTGTTGGSPISTPLTNFFHASNGVKIRFFSTTQTATNLDVDFIRIQPIIDSIYHPASVTNLNGSGGALAGTYANAHVVGNSASAQQSVTAGNAVYLTGAGTAGSIADYYLSFANIKTYSGMNTIYFKADYSCSAATAGLDTEFAIYNFTGAAWEDLTSAAIACSTTDATHAWAKNNVTIADYINGGETRIRYYGDLNSTTTLRLDFAYLTIGSTNSDTADCAITFGSGTATNCSNTRDLIGPGTAARFDNPAEDESATMGTGDANSYHAFDNETTPDVTTEESTSANISFPVTQPANSSIVGQNYAARFSGCGNTGAACGAATLTVQLGFRDYAGFNQATGGWLQLGGTSASSTLAYTDTITAMTIAVYGQQISPEDYIDTTNNKVNMRLRTTTPGTAATNVTTVWDFAMVSLQWIEIGSTIDIQGNSSVASATIAAAVDGLLQVGKTATAAGGPCPCAWTISSVFVVPEQIVTVWSDAASDANESSAFTKYDGTSNITGMELTAHYLSVGSGDNQSISYADIEGYHNPYDNDNDEDIMFTKNGATLLVDATGTYTDERIDVMSGETLTVSGTETLSSLDVVINGTLTSGGNSAYTVGGSWTNSGTFTASTSTATFNSSTGGRTLSGTLTGATGKFYDITFNNVNGAWGLSAAIETANDFTVTDGSVTTNNNTVTVGRDFTLTNNIGTLFTAGSSTINVVRHFNDVSGTKFVEGTSTVNQTGTGTITVGTSGDFNNLSVGYSGFVTTFSNNAWDVYGTLTFNAGTVTGGGAYMNLRRTTTGTSVVFVGPTTLNGTETIYHTTGAASFTYTIAGGNYGTWGLVPYAAHNSVTFTLGGNVSASTGFMRLEADNGITGSAFNTSGSNYSLSVDYLNIAPCAPARTGAWAIDFNDSTVTFDNTTFSLFLGNNCGSHTLDLDTSAVTVNGSVELVDGTTSVTVTPGSSDFTFAPTASQTETYAPNGQSLWNMIINGADSAATIQPTAAVDVNGNFTITAGTYDTVTGSNHPLTVGGNFANSGTFTAQNANVTFDGTATQTVSGTVTGSSALYNLIVTNASGASASDCERTGFTPSIDFNVDVTVSNNLTFTTANTRIEFDDANTYTFNNINWNGQAAGTRIFFRNSATSGTWLLKVTGTQTAVSYINVSRSDASVVGGSTIVATDGTNVDCNNNTNWNFSAGSTYEQADFRFGNEPEDTSTDSDYTGAPAENTAYPTTGTGDIFRLRQLIHVGGSNLGISGETFKLRFGEKTASDCTTGVTWADVATASGVIRYSNGSPADGDNIVSNAGDPDHAGHTKRYQDYEEANNFTNSVAAINVGEDGVWSFSLENNSAVGGKRYCFKVTKSDNSDLNTYTFYPEVIVEEELVASLDATSKDFGVIQPGANPTDVSSTLTTSTNSSTGYVVYTWSTGLMTRGSFTISDWTGTNTSPTTFGNGSFGFGYTTNDVTLTGGTADRFNPGGAGAKYAGFGHAGPGDPVADRTTGPTTGQTNTITYRIAASGTQAAGKYQTVIVYVWSVTF